MQPKHGMATKEEIDELLTFLGGFEKWSVLIEDCRREVVKYLDHQSRFNLGICSKDDYQTVEKTKICVESIEIVDNERVNYEITGSRRGGFDNVAVRIHFPTERSIEWVFFQIDQDTRVRWRQMGEQRPKVKEVVWESCNYYEEAVKFAEKWMKKCNFELTFLFVEMAKYPFANSQIKLLPCCKDVRIRACDMNTFEWWLKKCPEQLDFLHLGFHSEGRESFTLPSEFLNAPQIIQASNILFGCRVACSDEDLLKLKAKSIAFNCVDVTDIGINKFMRNWAKGKSVKGFEELYMITTTVRNPDLIMAGLDEVKEWDEAFENEQREFVEDFKRRFGRRQCYQIKSKVDRFESLTLCIDDGVVAIYATGKRVENNGEVSTCYRFPESDYL